MNIMLCESSDKHKYNTAKARKDTREIVKGMGYRDVALFHNNHPKALIPAEIVISCVRALLSAKKGDNLFFQYPYYPAVVNKTIFSILRFGKRLRHYKVTMLIHDVIALRSRLGDPDGGQKALHSEAAAWEWIDNVICHTENMKAALEKTGIPIHFSVLGPFYYLYEGETRERAYSDAPVVMVAGNLLKEKCGYVYELSNVKDVKFDLFGTNYTGKNNEHIHYRGKFEPVELISHLDGQFGLVWDGDSVDTCSGDFGNYLKYNSPHKFSLYLAAGVPLIVWRESALAKYVEENEIGLCVDSLTELPAVFNAISPQAYEKMCLNVMDLRKRIINGENLKLVLKSE